MDLHWHFIKILTGFTSDFPWYFIEISNVILLELHMNLQWILKKFYLISDGFEIVFHWYFIKISAGFLIDFHWYFI